jgi:adenylate cyclase
MKEMASLAFLKPPEFAAPIELNQKIVTIGKSAENTICLDLPTIAPVHASIVIDGNNYLLIDHSSKHGTFVDGIRIDRAFLQPGNIIKLGKDAKLLFSLQSKGKGRQVLITSDRGGNHIGEDIQTTISLDEPAFQGEREQKVPQAEMQKKHLAAIYQVHQSITEILDLDELTQKVLDLIFEILPADRAAVIFCDEELEHVYPVAFKERKQSGEPASVSISQTIIGRTIGEKTAILAKDTFLDSRFRNVTSIKRKNIRSVMCVPLNTKNNAFGALYIDALNVPGGFSEEDLRLLIAVGGALANAIENSKLIARIKEEQRKLTTLERYLPSLVVDHLFREKDSNRLGGKHASVAVLFADIRGFTPFAEKFPPADVVSILNEYFTAMSEVVFEFGGTLGEYIGDEIMAYFGAPIECENYAAQAITVAQKMMETMSSLKQTWERRGAPTFNIGIGIATGAAVAGNIGSPKQMKYTVIGSTVNLASRLCARAGSGQILICPETYQAGGKPENARFLEETQLKGISKPVQVYGVEYVLSTNAPDSSTPRAHQN